MPEWVPWRINEGPRYDAWVDTSSARTVRQPTWDFTQWAVIGTVGGLACILRTSQLLIR